jgi:hypothetical protein
LLDRAVAGYVRAFLPVLAILAVAAVPGALAWAFLGNATQFSADLSQLARLGPSDTAMRQMLLARSVSTGFSLAFAGLIGAGFTLLARTACYIFIEASCDEMPTTIGDAFRRALPLWLSQVGLLLVFAIVGGVIGAVVTVVGIIVGVVVGLSASIMHVPSSISGIVVIVVLVIVFVVLIACALFFTLAYYLASVTVARGERNPWRAFTASTRPLLDRRHWRTTAAIAATILAISLFASFIAVVLGLAAAAITRVPSSAIFVQSIAAVVLSGLIQWFVVLYARDVRDRRTGDDLLRLVEADAPA